MLEMGISLCPCSGYGLDIGPGNEMVWSWTSFALTQPMNTVKVSPDLIS